MAQINVSIIQLEARLSKSGSLTALEKLIGGAKGDLILAPEYSMFDPTGLDPSAIAMGAEEPGGEWLSRIRSKAREKGSCIVVGFFEKAPGASKPYNSVAVIDDRGEIAGIYRKTHLFDALGFRESNYFTPGEKLFDPVEVCGVKLGLAICFEIRYPEVIRHQAIMGAEIVAIPSAWYRGIGKEEQYRFLARARAHENTVWIAAPILYGDSFTGRSLVVDPLGVVRADAGYGEKILEYTINTREIEEARRKLPLLELRRPSLYKSLTG